MRLAGAAAAGAVVGSLARYGIGTVLGSGAFPWATLTVNLIGAFAIGGLSRLAWIMNHDARRHFAVTGVLGGFTTFSALALDTVRLADQPLHAAAYLAVTLGGGLLATHVGWRVAS